MRQIMRKLANFGSHANIPGVFRYVQNNPAWIEAEKFAYITPMTAEVVVCIVCNHEIDADLACEIAAYFMSNEDLNAVIDVKLWAEQYNLSYMVPKHMSNIVALAYKPAAYESLDASKVVFLVP